MQLEQAALLAALAFCAHAAAAGAVTRQHLAPDLWDVATVRLERLMRYCARPPLADDRLQRRPDGHVLLELETPWHDGTTHLDLDPLDFLARCAALIPRPHKNLVVYHGVLAAHARLRARAVDYGRPAAGAALVPSEPSHCCVHDDADRVDQRGPAAANRPRSSARRGLWADLMRRAFGFDLLTCSSCGGKMALLACILDRRSIARILGHLQLPTDGSSRLAVVCGWNVRDLRDGSSADRQAAGSEALSTAAYQPMKEAPPGGGLSEGAYLRSQKLARASAAAVAHNNIGPEIEKIPMTGIDEAWSKVVEKKARYRYVIDLQG